MDRIRKIKYFKALTGSVPFNDWYVSLKDKRARLYVAGKLRQIQNPLYSNYSSVGGGVFELRIFLGPGYRIYFGFENEDLVVILLAGDKSTQGKDIKTALKIWRNYLNATNRF